MEKRSYFPALFQAGRIGRLRLRNRIVQLPTGGNFMGPVGEVSERTISYYVERSRGGVGLIIVGGVRALPKTKPADSKFLNLAEEALLPGHYYLCEAVRPYGAKIAIQLTHPGSQVSLADWGGEQPPSPSGVQQFNAGGRPYAPPRPISKEEILEMIESFGKAILNAKRVGYDLVEIHAGHGHLLGAFLSPATNKRADDFGGNLENRTRFVTEIIKQGHRMAGADFPISVRISADEFLPDGITLEESGQIVRALERAGAAAINISCGTYRNQHKVSDTMRMAEGWKTPLWAAIKQSATIPTIAGGGLRNPEFCARLLEEGKADFIGLARQIQADPYWPQKVAEGRPEDLNRCISCLRCLYSLDGRPLIVRECTVNPMWGREVDFIDPKPPREKKRVLIIGGGPGGMEAARVASMRGHEVTLCEKRKELGGQLLLSAVAPGKEKILWFRNYLVNQITKQHVEIRLNCPVDPEMIEREKPDVLILATGALPLVPAIPGIDQANVVTAEDVLAGKIELKHENIVILGGGNVGCETAEFLVRKGKKVTLVEELPVVAQNMEPLNRRSLLEALEESKVKMLTESKAVEIGKDGVRILNTKNGNRESVGAEHIVLALGTKSDQTLIELLEGKASELHMIGDCFEPRTALDAVREGFLVGHRI